MAVTKDPFRRFCNHPNLPSPTGVAMALLDLAERDDTVVDQFVRLIRTDPALSQRIIQIVNSPFAGLTRPIVDVRQAAILLGLKTVAVVALGVSIIDASRGGACHNFNYRLFWSESLARATAMQQICGIRRVYSPQEAFTLGLLADIGRLVFAAVAPAEYADLLSHDDGADGRHAIMALEKEHFGLHRDDLTARLLQRWGLPSNFFRAVEMRDSLETLEDNDGLRARLLAEMLNVAWKVGALVVLPVIEAESLAAVAVDAVKLGSTAEDFDVMFDSIAEEWRRAGKVLDISTRRVPPAEEIRQRATARSEALRQAGGLSHLAQGI